jgi:hypothetical protein
LARGDVCKDGYAHQTQVADSSRDIVIRAGNIGLHVVKELLVFVDYSVHVIGHGLKVSKVVN